MERGASERVLARGRVQVGGVLHADRLAALPCVASPSLAFRESSHLQCALELLGCGGIEDEVVTPESFEAQFPGACVHPPERRGIPTHRRAEGVQELGTRNL